MEGPSLVIASTEMSKFFGKKVNAVSGSQDWNELLGQKFISAKSWGKHFILIFSKQTLRIHFLMFGSYRIDHPRENRIPKLQLSIGGSEIYFYSCAIKEIDPKLGEYDWSTDLMSKDWDAKKVLKLVRSKPETMICDLLMDQDIFSGLGNIMKNEILFRLKLHPELKVKDLSPSLQRKLVKTSRDYAFDFYEWKKKNVLKKNWLIMRKKKCPVCGRKVKKKPTGKLQRLSHFCSFCQAK